MIIKKLRIRNFRSIADLQIDLNDLSVIMGDNDAGKSNVLRALNLFFNGRTDVDRSFYFPFDFNMHAVVPTNKAREIIIELVIDPPQSYQDAREIMWRKVWRRDGPMANREVRRFADGTEFSARSRINTWLSRIKFKYVPATKGADYFSQLLGELHDSLSNTVDDQIKAAATGFTTTINTHTQPIFQQLDARLGIKSSIQLPADLKVLFANLDFQANKTNISLQQRGDGIKARHIPIILRFLADQDNILRDSGSAKFNHIWGYEEPENNLELSKAFKMAEDFSEYSDEVQVLLTTHSPAFYRLHERGASVHYVSKDQTETISQIASIGPGEVDALDSIMGVMPLITPHVQAAVTSYETRLNVAEELSKLHIKKPTLFLEGPSDVAIIKKAINVFFPDVLDKITIRHSEKNGGGEGWVTDMLIAWMHAREQHKCLGIFDADDQGKLGKKRVADNPKYSKQGVVKATTLPTPKHLTKIFSAGLRIGVCIEDMAGNEIWDHALNKGWLVQRPNLISLNPSLAGDLTVPVIQKLEEKKLSQEEMARVIHTVADKEAFSKYIANLSHDRATDQLLGLQDTAKQIVEHLLP